MENPSTDALRQLRHEAERARQALADAIDERDELPGEINAAIMAGDVPRVRELRVREAGIADEVAALEVVALRAEIAVERAVVEVADREAIEAARPVAALKEQASEARATLAEVEGRLADAERAAAVARMQASGRRERVRVLGSRLSALRQARQPSKPAGPVIGDPAGQGVRVFDVVTGDDRARRVGGTPHTIEVRR